MSDEERELTPEQEADVRRLLAEARATEPVPPEVAARLDRALLDLREEPGLPVAHVQAPPSRRRRAGALLVAAAAVVVAGVGIGQVDWSMSGNDSADSDGGGGGAVADLETQPEAVEDQADGESLDRPNATAQSRGPKSGPGIAPVTPDPAAAVGQIRESEFATDAEVLRSALPEDAADGQFARLARDLLPADYLAPADAFECPPAPWGNGVLVPVLSDGTAAVLAYRPALGESQVVELLQCGTGEALRSTTLPAG